MTSATPSTEVLEHVEARAWADFTSAAPAVVAAEVRPGATWHAGALVSWVPEVDAPLFNRALGIGLSAPAREEDVGAIAAWFERAGSPRAFIQVAPGARPSELPRWLEARGFAVHNRWAKLWRRLDDLPPEREDVRVERIGPERAEVFGEILGGAFAMPAPLRAWLAATVGRPRWDHYLAYLDGVPVATGILTVYDGIARLEFAGTSAEARGRGAQPALIARRLGDAARLGCSLAVTGTAEDRPDKSAPSFRNMRRMGFELAYFRHNWLRVRSSGGPTR